MEDRLDKIQFYQKACTLWDLCRMDSSILMQDSRGKIIAYQLTRSVGSICANIEEGNGRGFQKEYPHFLTMARGSARESKGWYKRSKFLLSQELIDSRIKILDEIIAMLTATINTLNTRKK